MQRPITDLVRLGPLPNSQERNIERLKTLQALIAAVQKPITDEEACVLVRLLGTDDAFGLAWSILHLIETAPGWPIWHVLSGTDNEWVALLAHRSRHLSVCPKNC